MIGGRRVRDLMDDDGSPIKGVSLPGKDNEAFLHVDDFRLLFELGLSTAWRISSGYVVAPSAKAPGGFVNVARVMLGAGPGQVVRYLDGDPYNLRRSNLALEEGHGTRTDRNLVNHKPQRMTRVVSKLPGGFWD